MSDRLDDVRLLIYSHDTFGLGHLRRCRAIAHSLVERYKGLSVLIVTGSPIAGSFDYKARVDFVRIPGVIKLRNGDYTSLNLHIDLQQTLSIREAIIRQTAETFAPNLFLVDKEPLGLMGEIRDTLTMLKARGTRLVLGLRDILDDAALLTREWERKRVLPVLDELYDEIWVYGTERIWPVLDGVEVPPSIRQKLTYLGYLPRPLARSTGPHPSLELERPFVLVTAGGGGDGADMIDWVLSAYEREPDLPVSALLVLGPFMSSELQAAFMERARRLDRVQAIIFDARIERIMAEAEAVIAMGGYNTFCEILTLDKPALLVPRSTPRREQLIRASRAQEMGLARMLDGEGPRDPRAMAEAIRALPHQARPSRSADPELMAGLDNLGERLKLSLGLAGGPEVTHDVAHLKRA
jgi:predicted glycosyltransferase